MEADDSDNNTLNSPLLNIANNIKESRNDFNEDTHVGHESQQLATESLISLNSYKEKNNCWLLLGNFTLNLNTINPIVSMCI